MDFGGNDKRSLFVQYVQGNYANVHARTTFMPHRVVFHISRIMLMLHFGYESTVVVYGRSSLKVMDFGKTRSYGLRMCRPVTTG